MGKRRIRLLKEMYPEYRIVGVDSREDRRNDVKENYSISCYSSLDDVVEKIDCAFVCTSQLSHNAIIEDCLVNLLYVLLMI